METDVLSGHAKYLDYSRQHISPLLLDFASAPSKTVMHFESAGHPLVVPTTHHTSRRVGTALFVLSTAAEGRSLS